MSKALELKVYPMWDNGFGEMYADMDDPRRPARVDFEVYRKRLTPTELAAEYWFMEAVNADLRASGASGGAEIRDTLEAIADLETIRRFATLPHYDEVPA